MFQKIKFFILSIKSLLIGMKVTIKNYFAKSVTLNYPIKKQPMTANFRGMVDLKPEACVICYQCIKICPVAALDLVHKQVVADGKKKNEITKFTYNAELCCFCGLCDEICPTDAIFMNKMYEVSTYSHDQLNIDLMKEDKYKYVNANYNFADEVKRNDANTIGIVLKPPVAPAPAAGSSTPEAPKPTTTDKPTS
ncbi:MAG TPA: 4Fe-4S binding protein [Candidatus Omnitrophota bacterium]|nr:4Fe-4S binding protein [Candidatus Omnitrophota bacterium]